MKLKHLLLAGIAAGAANMAMANTGTITFSGQVVDSTCAVTVNNTSASATVTLPTVKIQELANANDTAGATPFTIDVTGCTAITTPPITSIKTRFLAQDADGANLANTAGTATNVAIQLLEDTGVIGSTGDTALNFTTGYAESGTQLLADATGSGVVQFPFVARYIATGGATAGTVQAIVDYELVYQ